MAALLSPSQISTYLDCSARWYYKYALELPDAKSAALALGIAFHEGVAANYQQKIESKRDLATPGVVAVFRSAFARELETARLGEDDDLPGLARTGEACVARYMEETAPFVEPAAVELEVTGEIAGVKVRGRVDVIDVEGRIRDAKTASKSPSGVHQNHRRQMAIYAAITPGASGEVTVDTVTKTKATKVVPQSFRVDARDRRHIETLLPIVQEGMRSGLYVPNRGSLLCSQRNCPYWEQCEAEYGGRVDAR